MIKKNGGIFGRNPTYNDVVVEGTLTLREAQVFDNDITINGDLTVNGTTTTINTVELNVDDKNITMGAVVAKVGLVSTSNITSGQFTVLIADTAGLVPGMTVTKTAGTGAFAAGAKIASVDSHYQITLDLAHTASGSITFDTGGATDFTADGGGITLKGLTDKFMKWVKSTGAWTFSDKIEVPDVTVTNMTASLAVFTDSNKKLITQSQQNALNAIAGAVTSGRFLRGDGTNVSMSAIQAADVPTLNQSTTGNADTATTANNLKSNATTGLLQVTGPGAGTTRVMTTPNANFTAARTDATQTFTGVQNFTNGLAAGSSDALFGGIDGYTPQIQTRAGDTNSSGFGVFAFTSGGVGRIQVNRSKSTTIGTNTALANGDVVGIVQYGAADGTSYVNAADVRAYVDGAVSTSVVPGRLSFHVNNGGSTNPVEAVRIGSNTNMSVLLGNLVIGTSGKGIDFSVTSQAGGMTSELLADYEEGTWTPTMISGTTSPTVTYGLQRGVYTKVGRVVTVSAYLSWTAYSGGSGDAYIGGLPFTIESAIGAYGGAAIAQLDGATYAATRTAPGLMALSGTTSLRFMCFGSAVSSSTINVSSIAASGSIVFTCTYSV